MLSFSMFKHLVKYNKQFVRFKNKPDHWSVLKKKKFPIDKALEHFDEFYKQVFNTQWPVIRQALLGKQKYVAVVNNFSDTERIIEKLQNDGAINVQRIFELEKEYINELFEKNKRVQRLEKIWRMDRATEKQNRVEQKIDSIEEGEDSSAKNFSLDKALSEAELDSRRLVDARNALSTEILHEFIPATKLKGMEDFVDESSHYEYYDKSSNFVIEKRKEYDINFPNHLNIFCFEEGNMSNFDPAKKGSTGVLDYYLMDGGSILPVLALDIQPGNRVLDMCASPGGKTLLALQTLYPDCVVSNDSSFSRVKRIHNVLNQFVYDLDDKWIKTGRIKVTNMDARDFYKDDFDRILVDVPCTTDRHSLVENDNNIFKQGRMKERLQLPELQCALLVQALKIIKKGGIIVYSTCSLSPIQNDGVVHMALKQIWEETKLEFVVKDMNRALVQTRNVFKLASAKLMKYGHLVIPDPEQNYGPMYFCKLERVK